MKKFNKLLAVVLSLIMLLSVVPVAVFANEGSGSASQGEASYVATPGTGADGTITLTLDADALIAALKGEKSTEALVALLKDAIDRSTSNAFTKNDLLYLVPVAEILATVKANAPEAYNQIMYTVQSSISQEELYAFAVENDLVEAAVNAFQIEFLTDEEFLVHYEKYIAKYNELDALDSSDPNYGDLAEAIIAELEVLYDELNECVARVAVDYFVPGFTFSLETSMSEAAKNLNYAKVLPLIDALSAQNYADLAQMVGVRNLLSAVKANLSELASKELIEGLAQAIIFDMVATIDLFRINGYTVVYDDPTTVTDWFEIDYENAARALKSAIPSFTELANATDGKILSFNVELAYKGIYKDLNVEIVLDDGVETFCKFAQKLADHITIDKVGNDLYIDLTMPYELTEALAWYLEDCEKGEYIKDEILGIPDMTGKDLVTALENMTWDRIINLFKHIDVEELYNYIMTLSKVQILLEKVQDRLGLDYDLSKLENLDTILAEIADGTPRITLEMAEKICDKISDRVKMDITSYIGKGAAFIESSATVEYYLTKLESAPYIGKYIAKFNNVDSWIEIYENYKDMPVVDALAAVIERELNKDLMAFLNSNDTNAIYDRLIQEIEERSETISYIFERVKDYMLAAADPNYVANSGWGKLFQALVPDEIYSVANKSLANAYRGNGKFELLDKKFENVNLSDNADNLLNLIFGAMDLSDDYIALINHFMPTEVLSSLTFGVHFNVTFPGVSRAIFLDEKGNVSKTMFLPNGAHPGRFYTVGEDFSFWVDQNGELVSVITKDVTLSPVCEFISGGYLDIDANGNWTITSTTENFNIVVNLTNPKADPIVAEMIEAIKAANSITFANIQGLKMTMDQGLMAKVITEDTDIFAVSYSANKNSGTISAANGAYTFKPAKIDNFGLAVNGAAMNDFDGESFVITIPFKNAIETTGEKRTNVYNIVDGKLTTEALNVTVTDDAVVLDATHFSKYVVVNEYYFSTNFYTADGQLYTKDTDGSAAKGFVPEGATVTVRPQFTYRPGKRIISISYNGTNVKLGQTITMPSKAVTLKCVIEEQTETVIYNIFGTYYNDEADALAALLGAKLPAGYSAVDTAKRWVVSAIDNSIIYYVPALTATQIKVIFTGATSIDDTFSIDDLSLNVPAIERKEGYSSFWSVDGENALNLADIIASGKTEVTATVVYKAISADAKVTYTINGVEFNAAAGSVASFDVVLENGQTLAAAPAGCTLSSMTIVDGKTVYTYTFTVQNGLAITYTVNTDGNAVTQLVNGMETKDTETDIKGLKFAGFSGILEFANGSYQFALFSAEGKTANLIWLWILLALIVIFGAIALIYNLYINEKMKPGFLTRFATWAVTLFFNACIAISGLFLMITQGTSEKGKVNFEALGMKAPEAEAEAEAEATETAEETVAEETVEATDGDEAVAAVETVETEEIAVDEATEATEATEEVTETAEETAPEAVEEATEETAETTEDAQN